MSQTLTKPVMLDETGQDISSKINGVSGKLDSNGEAIVNVLEDIKDAIGTASDFIPIMIKVITPPTKTAYRTGEPLNLSGIVVNLIGSNGVQIDVTTACTFSPANGTPLTSADTSVTISYYYAVGDVTFTTTTPIGVKELSSIAVTTAPTKTAYKAGETLDLTGMVVTATYDDYSTLDVTNNCTFSPADGTALTTSDTTITATYVEGSVTKTATQAISVKELSSIAVTTPPTTTTYDVDDVLDLTGIEVTATYSDGSTEDVTSSCTFNPADGATLSGTDDTVTITFTELGITKTTTQSIVVIVIYGAEWDGTSSSAWTRTDAAAGFTDPVPQLKNSQGTAYTEGSSPFDTIQPWAGMTVVEDAEAGTLVRIPKFYYKWTRDGVKMKLQISTAQFDGSHISPAHMDRGDGYGERDVVYIGKYHCCDTNYKSATNDAPKGSETRATFRTAIHNLGSEIWQQDYTMFWTIRMLYLVEFADWNCQTKINLGGGLSRNNNGATDSMTYHTGGDQAENTKCNVLYRNIENLWANVLEWIDGIYFYIAPYKSYLIVDPNYFSDSTPNPSGHSYVLDGVPNFSGTAGISKYSTPTESGVEFALVPIEASGSVSSYVTDGLNDWRGNEQFPRTGGSPGLTGDDLRYCGLFFLNTGKNGEYSTGGRLMKLPANS